MKKIYKANIDDQKRDFKGKSLLRLKKMTEKIEGRIYLGSTINGMDLMRMADLVSGLNTVRFGLFK